MKHRRDAPPRGARSVCFVGLFQENGTLGVRPCGAFRDGERGQRGGRDLEDDFEADAPSPAPQFIHGTVAPGGGRPLALSTDRRLLSARRFALLARGGLARIAFPAADCDRRGAIIDNVRPVSLSDPSGSAGASKMVAAVPLPAGSPLLPAARGSRIRRPAQDRPNRPATPPIRPQADRAGRIFTPGLQVRDGPVRNRSARRLRPCASPRKPRALRGRPRPSAAA